MPAPEFVSLAELLCRSGDAPAPVTDLRSEPDVITTAPPCEVTANALREAKLFRARLQDALEEAMAGLLRELASCVLARELQVAPCDLAALLSSLLEGAPGVRVRVAAQDAALQLAVPVVADPVLQPGDAIVELVGGALDARLGVRLAHVLEEFA